MSNAAQKLEIDGDVATITLDCPERYNCFDAEMLGDLLGALRRIEDDASVRAMILTGSGPAFAAGARIDDFADVAALPQRMGELIDLAHDVVSRVARFPIPVVMALNGVVAGGAIGLVLAGDYIVAADLVKFRTAYAGIGFVGDAGVTKLLAQAIGPRRARSYLLTNRTFSAEQAMAWGMIDELVPPGQLMSRARELATELASGPTAAFRRMKTLVAEATGNSQERHLARERELMMEIAQTADAREGIRAFLEKRPPRFVGR